MDIETDPSVYIQYFERHGFAFQSVIEENVQKAGGEFGSDAKAYRRRPGESRRAVFLLWHQLVGQKSGFQLSPE
jgi:hypothetical protein